MHALTGGACTPHAATVAERRRAALRCVCVDAAFRQRKRRATYNLPRWVGREEATARNQGKTRPTLPTLPLPQRTFVVIMRIRPFTQVPGACIIGERGQAVMGRCDMGLSHTIFPVIIFACAASC